MPQVCGVGESFTVTDVLSSKVTVLGSVAETHGMFSALLKVPMVSATRRVSLPREGDQRAAWQDFSFLGRYCRLYVAPVLTACAV